MKVILGIFVELEMMTKLELEVVLEVQSEVAVTVEVVAASELRGILLTADSCSVTCMRVFVVVSHDAFIRQDAL